MAAPHPAAAASPAGATASDRTIRFGVGWHRASLVIGLLLLIALAWRQLHFVDRYAVNMMCWDQWDDYWPMFRGQGWWACFNYQPGPQRQGSGELLMRCLASASGWNSRVDSFSISCTLIAAALLAIRLAWLCGARGVALIALPLLFFNVRQYQQLVVDANVAHGAMPIFLLMLFALAWFVRNRLARLALVSALTFLLIFTGYGIFVGLLTPIVLLLELLQHARRQERRDVTTVAIALAAVIISWMLFLHGYQFDLASSGVKFPWDRPLQCVAFIGVMLANFFGIAGNAGALGITLGLAIAAALVAIASIHARRIVRQGVVDQPSSVVILCLTAFALLYVFDTALGRSMFRPSYGAQSRYVTLMIPAGLAILLHLDEAGRSSRARLGARWAMGAFALLLALGTTVLHEADWTDVEWLHNGCQAWKTAYLATGDIAAAERISQFPMHPDPQGLGDRLTFLREHRLNLFLPDAQKP